MNRRNGDLNDVAGKQYGYLLGIKRLDKTYALYKCLRCGTEVKKRYGAVVQGITKSCGCMLQPTARNSSRYKNNI